MDKSFEAFNKFVTLIRAVTDGDVEILKLLQKRFNKARMSYIESEEFRRMLALTRNKIEDDSLNKYVHIREIVVELKAYEKADDLPSAADNETPSTSRAPSPEGKQKRKVKLNRMEESPPAKKKHEQKKKKDESDEEKEEQGEEEPINPKHAKHVRKLEKMLELVNKEIITLETKEVSLDDMEDDESSYVQLDRYKRKSVQIWDKLCELKKRNKSAGRILDEKFRYSGSKFPEINNMLERFVNKLERFPDYGDIVKIIERCKKKYHLKISKVADLAKDIFTDAGNSLQQRRENDFVQNFGCHLTDRFSTMDDPALYDRELRAKLAVNRKKANTNLEAVIQKYAYKQEVEGDETDEDDKEDGDRSASPSPSKKKKKHVVSDQSEEDDAETSGTPRKEKKEEEAEAGTSSGQKAEMDVSFDETSYQAPSPIVPVSPITPAADSSSDDLSSSLPDVFGSSIQTPNKHNVTSRGSTKSTASTSKEERKRKDVATKHDDLFEPETVANLMAAQDTVTIPDDEQDTVRIVEQDTVVIPDSEQNSVTIPDDEEQDPVTFPEDDQSRMAIPNDEQDTVAAAAVINGAETEPEKTTEEITPQAVAAGSEEHMEDAVVCVIQTPTKETEQPIATVICDAESPEQRDISDMDTVLVRHQSLLPGNTVELKQNHSNVEGPSIDSMDKTDKGKEEDGNDVSVCVLDESSDEDNPQPKQSDKDHNKDKRLPKITDKLQNIIDNAVNQLSKKRKATDSTHRNSHAKAAKVARTASREDDIMVIDMLSDSDEETEVKKAPNHQTDSGAAKSIPPKIPQASLPFQKYKKDSAITQQHTQVNGKLCTENEISPIARVSTTAVESSSNHFKVNGTKVTMAQSIETTSGIGHGKISPRPTSISPGMPTITNVQSLSTIADARPKSVSNQCSQKSHPSSMNLVSSSHIESSSVHSSHISASSTSSRGIVSSTKSSSVVDVHSNNKNGTKIRILGEISQVAAAEVLDDDEDIQVMGSQEGVKVPCSKGVKVSALNHSQLQSKIRKIAMDLKQAKEKRVDATKPGRVFSISDDEDDIGPAENVIMLE